MVEVTGNLWTFPTDSRVITTNGTVKRDGSCVMGRGCALEAKQRWPDISHTLGKHITHKGNVVSILRFDEADGETILSFPVKHQWMQKADPALIERSAYQLVALADVHGWRVVVMPRPGCGNGHLRWCYCDLRVAGTDKTQGETDGTCSGVKHVLAPLLDDRFHVITFGGKS